jgi:hypothetical protein
MFGISIFRGTRFNMCPRFVGGSEELGGETALPGIKRVAVSSATSVLR